MKSSLRYITIIFSAILALLLQGCITEKDDPVWSIASGDKVPDFTVSLSDGSLWSSRSADHKVKVILFFNTDCPDCRRELPKVQEAFDVLCADKAADFICIAREETLDEIEAYWNSAGLTLPFSPQPDRTIYSLFASSGIPRIYIVGVDLVITKVFSPEDDFSATSLIEAINP
ncbi:MAG: TlpA family protein disulfide reductase [Muribaculum sp.]|nr:TlpA family protein disulfide reductase [Muribaculum sp.]